MRMDQLFNNPCRVPSPLADGSVGYMSDDGVFLGDMVPEGEDAHTQDEERKGNVGGHIRHALTIEDLSWILGETI